MKIEELNQVVSELKKKLQESEHDISLKNSQTESTCVDKKKLFDQVK